MQGVTQEQRKRRVPALTRPGAEQSARHVEPAVDDVAPLGRQRKVKAPGPVAPVDVHCINTSRKNRLCRGCAAWAGAAAGQGLVGRPVTAALGIRQASGPAKPGWVSPPGQNLLTGPLNQRVSQKPVCRWCLAQAMVQVRCRCPSAGRTG